MTHDPRRTELPVDLPTVIIVFSVDAPPFVAYSSTLDSESRQRIVKELSPEWHDILKSASRLFARERPDLQDSEDWFAEDEDE